MANAQKVNVVLEAVDKTKPAFDSLHKSLGGLKTAFFNVQTAIAAVIGGAVVGKIVEANKSFQSLEASLVTFTGSTEAASKQFAKLQQFAANTPFALEEVVGGFNKLIGRGIEPTIASFEAFGNIASGTGKTLDQFVEAVADAAVGEFERLKEFGIKASAEGDKVRMTFGGVTKEIGKNSTEILGYLENLGQTKFAGAIERQAKTLTGAFSNFGDAVDSLAVAIGKSGLNDFIIESTRSLTEFINRLREATEAQFGLTEAIKYAVSGKDMSRLDTIRDEIKSIENQINAQEELTAGISTSMTYENERLRILRAQEKLILGINKENSRGQGFADPRLLGNVGSITSQVEVWTAEEKALKDEIEAVNLAWAKSMTGREKAARNRQSVIDQTLAGLKVLRDKAFEEAKKATEEYNQTIIDAEVHWASAMTAGEKQARNRLKVIEDTKKAMTAVNKEFVSQYAAGRAKHQQSLSGEIIAIEEAMNSATTPFEQFKQSMMSIEDSMESVAVKGITRLEDALVGVVSGTMKAKDAFRSMALSIIQDLIRMQIQQAVTKPLTGWLGSVLGFRAEGGPVQSNKPYIVGEKGPELFIPNGNGSIVPNNKLSSGAASSDVGGTVINQTINLSTGVQQTVRAEVMSLLPQIANATKAAVADAKLRGGTFSAVMR